MAVLGLIWWSATSPISMDYGYTPAIYQFINFILDIIGAKALSERYIVTTLEAIGHVL